MVAFSGLLKIKEDDNMMQMAKIVASTPTAILVTLGGIGILMGIDRSGWLLALGVGLQALFLLR